MKAMVRSSVIFLIEAFRTAVLYKDPGLGDVVHTDNGTRFVSNWTFSPDWFPVLSAFKENMTGIARIKQNLPGFPVMAVKVIGAVGVGANHNRNFVSVEQA